NPQYKRDIIPGHGKPYLLNLPVSEALTFSEKRDSIYNYNFNTFFANINPNTNNGGNADDKERITHIVGKKETLMSIANKYGVTSSQIKKWNNLSS
ncbi:MAG TPA: lytic transglycosylase, partial [Porphyromonadaceae bacterium]|nr:lytic transglycosylase [Porphyromonadaceae bacterium]